MPLGRVHQRSVLANEVKGEFTGRIPGAQNANMESEDSRQTGKNTNPGAREPDSVEDAYATTINTGGDNYHGR